MQRSPVAQGLRSLRDLLATLSREYSLELLQELYARGWSTASEVARDLGIHVATAMRKLAELGSLGVLEKRVRPGSDLVEYRVARARIEIVLDLEEDARTTERDARGTAERIFVKEKPDRKILLEREEREERVKRVVFLRALRRRTEARSLILTETEGRFLSHLPFGSQSAASVASICRRAGIENPLQVARILDFVKEMERMGVIQVAR